jgi:hypothetical protein
MNTSFDFGTVTGERIVYVRPVPVADLPPELRAQTGTLQTVWAVHGEDGERLALVADRKLAFLIARQNDCAPVNVH